VELLLLLQLENSSCNYIIGILLLDSPSPTPPLPLFLFITSSWGVFSDVVSSHSFRAGGLQVVICPVLGRPDGYSAESGHDWCTHRLRAREIWPVHYVVLSSDILWLTGYVV